MRRHLFACEHLALMPSGVLLLTGFGFRQV